jgi:hypothetical protein
MDVLPLALTRTRARTRFKDSLGQSNHFLITILIGLDGVANGLVQKSPSFSTTWDPIDPARSADRSREFAQKTMLVWAVEALDAYRSGVSQHPFSVLDGEIAAEMNREKGLSARLLFLDRFLQLPPSADALLLQLAIVWRNRLVHSNPTVKLDGTTAGRLRARAEEIGESHGLDIESTIAKVRGTGLKSPTFKEVTSLVSAIQRYVQSLDHTLVALADTDRYLEDLIRSAGEADPRRFATNMWTKRDVRLYKALTQLGVTGGMSKDGEGKVSRPFHNELMTLTPQAALERFWQV